MNNWINRIHKYISFFNHEVSIVLVLLMGNTSNCYVIRHNHLRYQQNINHGNTLQSSLPSFLENLERIWMVFQRKIGRNVWKIGSDSVWINVLITDLVDFHGGRHKPCIHTVPHIYKMLLQHKKCCCSTEMLLQIRPAAA